jgi:hypothetical protein
LQGFGDVGREHEQVDHVARRAGGEWEVPGDVPVETRFQFCTGLTTGCVPGSRTTDRGSELGSCCCVWTKGVKARRLVYHDVSALDSIGEGARPRRSRTLGLIEMQRVKQPAELDPDAGRCVVTAPATASAQLLNGELDQLM